jgi:hypothetical protein
MLEGRPLVVGIKTFCCQLSPLLVDLKTPPLFAELVPEPVSKLMEQPETKNITNNKVNNLIFVAIYFY